MATLQKKKRLRPGGHPPAQHGAQNGSTSNRYMRPDDHKRRRLVEFPTVLGHDGEAGTASSIRFGLSGGLYPPLLSKLGSDDVDIISLRRSKRIWQPGDRTYLVYRNARQLASTYTPLDLRGKNPPMGRQPRIDRQVDEQLLYLERTHAECAVPADILAPMLRSELCTHNAQREFDNCQGNVVRVFPTYRGEVVSWPVSRDRSARGCPLLSRLVCASASDLLSPEKTRPESAWLDLDAAILQVDSMKNVLHGGRTHLAARTMLAVHLVSVDLGSESGLEMRSSASLQMSCSTIDMAIHPTDPNEITTISANKQVCVWDVTCSATAHPSPAVVTEGPIPRTTRRTNPVVRAQFPEQTGLRAPHRDYRQCQYGAHPRVLWLTDAESLYSLDLRAPPSPTLQHRTMRSRWSSPLSIAALHKHRTHPFHVLLGTSSHVHLIDSRMPRHCLADWRHGFTTAPRVLCTCETSLKGTQHAQSSVVMGCEFAYTESQHLHVPVANTSSTARQIFCFGYRHQQPGHSAGPHGLKLPSWVQLPRVSRPQRFCGLGVCAFPGKSGGLKSSTVCAFVATDEGDLMAHRFWSTPVHKRCDSSRPTLSDTLVHHCTRPDKMRSPESSVAGTKPPHAQQTRTVALVCKCDKRV